MFKMLTAEEYIRRNHLKISKSENSLLEIAQVTLIVPKAQEETDEKKEVKNLIVF